MKKFLISTFLGVTCLSLCIDAKGMEQPAEEQGRNVVLTEQESLKLDDMNALIRLLSESGEKYRDIISNLRGLISVVVDHDVTGPLYPNYPHQVFCEAIARGDVDMVRTLAIQEFLGYGNIDVNQADRKGVTPLMYAARSGSIEMVLLLNEFGCLGYNTAQEPRDDGRWHTVYIPIAQVDNHRNTLVHYAMKGGLQMIKYLWGTGYITNEDLSSAYDKSGVVPLVGACRDGNVELVKFLLDANADESNPENNTLALYSAIDSKHANEIVPLLLKRQGIDINGERYNRSPLHEAILSRNIEVAKLLIKAGADVNRKGKDKFGYPLIYAIARNQPKIVKLLLEQPSIQLDGITENGDTLLYLAANSGNVDIVRLIIDTGKAGDVNAICGGGTALYAAIQKNLPEVLQLLFDTFPDININVKFKNLVELTYLHWAVMLKKPKCVNLLLKRPEIEVNEQSDWGTPLTMAVGTAAGEEIIKLLLEHPKIDVNAVNNQKNTPILEAVQSFNFDELMSVLKYFIAHYKSKGIPLPSKAEVQSRLDKRSKKTWRHDYLSDEQKQQILDLFPAK